jgi:hypothetical protein
MSPTVPIGAAGAASSGGAPGGFARVCADAGDSQTAAATIAAQIASQR